MNDQFKTDCLEIVKLAMETPEAKAHVMAEWVAHCQFFAVRVYMGGWEAGANPDLSAECHNIEAKNHTPDYHTDSSVVLAKLQALLA